MKIVRLRIARPSGQLGLWWDARERRLQVLWLQVQLGLSLTEEWRRCSDAQIISRRMKRWYSRAHWCDDFDGLLVTDDMTEVAHCGCFLSEETWWDRSL